MLNRFNSLKKMAAEEIKPIEEECESIQQKKQEVQKIASERLN